jgi:dGTP triphosphohydrolase
MRRRTNIKTPRGAWPAPYEVDSAINKRAQAMARAGKPYSRTESNAQARKIVSRLFGRNAHVDSGTRAHIATLLWNDYQSYGPKTNPKGRKMTKAQKRVNASKKSKQKRMAAALRKFLKAQNPAANYAGAKIQRNKGSITIIPIKLRRASR